MVLIVTPQFKYLLACETAQPIPDKEYGGKILIIQPIMKLPVPFIPTQTTFTIAGGIIDLIPGIKYDAKITLTDPKGNEKTIGESTLEVEPQENKKAEAMGQLGYELRNFEIHHEGYYSIKAYIDDELKMEYSFEVFIREDGE